MGKVTNQRKKVRENERNSHSIKSPFKAMLYPLERLSQKKKKLKNSKKHLSFLVKWLGKKI